MPTKRLPPTAYQLAEGETFVPYTYGQTLAAFTFKAVITGALLGIVFGAANTYLGLKAGLTISTSIPIAVLTVVVFRLLDTVGIRHTILESNISQTVGSASSSVASGVLFTIPALFIWGIQPAWAQITLLAMAGGLIGVVFMIPLRRYLIKGEHGKLPYPEGMASAEVLVAAEGGGKQAAGVFWGLGVGMLFKWITDGLRVVQDAFHLGLGYKATIGISVSPPLIGVGYILGIRIATVMAAGGALSALILIPAINLWGGGLTEPVFPETVKLIRDMTPGELWHRYVRYIGAGAVAMGGIITLIRSIPTMIESFRLGLSRIATAGSDAAERYDREMPLRVGLLVLGGVILMLTFTPGVLGFLDAIWIKAIAAVLIAVFAFFFVTVSSRIVGLVGVTSNPTSGMTIATLLGTSLIFYLMGWTDLAGKATALMVGTAVCIAASISGDMSQDLKTGYVLGQTPRLQQIGEMIGVLTSAGVVALVVLLLHRSVEGGLGGPELPAPQAMLMKVVIDGVLDQNLPWTLVGIGAGIGVAAALVRVPVLAFAVGVYLPLETMAAVFVGGVVRWALTRKRPTEEAERRREEGVLFGAGLVGGGGLTGVLLALWVSARGGKRLVGYPLDLPGPYLQLIALAAIGALVGLLWWHVVRASGVRDA
ncbi:MAG TPA: oligopeptide transporter, OPT family [Gemmatimonadales bacterium]